MIMGWFYEVMWGVLIGIAYGIGAYFVNVLFAGAITAKTGKVGKYVFVLVIVKYVALLGILIGMAFVGMDVMLWTAGGFVVTIIGCAVCKSIRAAR